MVPPGRYMYNHHGKGRGVERKTNLTLPSYVGGGGGFGHLAKCARGGNGCCFFVFVRDEQPPPPALLGREAAKASNIEEFVWRKTKNAVCQVFCLFCPSEGWGRGA